MKFKDDTVEEVKYSDAENFYRDMIIQRIEDSRDQREQNHIEFDDQTYTEHWTSNMKAASSYIRPKLNEQDVRVVTGTTREKNNTLLASILNFNLEPDVVAFDDQDMVLNDLGTVMEDMIRKSRQLEVPDYDLKRVIITAELLNQGTVFVEDTHIEYRIPNKELDVLNWSEDVNIGEIKWKDRFEKIISYSDTNLICGLNVYLGNVKEFYMEKQPYIAIKRIIPRAEAERLYGKWERWKNVPKQKSETKEDDNVEYYNWTLESFDKNYVEEIKYQDKWNNEYQILLNGVMMLPIKFPLAALNGESEYTVAKGDLEPISRFFAYSKSIPAKTKVDQQIFDEMMKNMVLKTRGSFQPALANRTGMALGKKIYMPGTIHDNIDPNKISPILENNGVTQSEFAMVQFLKTIIDGKTSNPVFSGEAMKGRQTAREILELKNQGMMKIGIAVLGVVNLEKKLCWLRLLNIIKNWTKEVDVKIDEVKGALSDETDVKLVKKGQYRRISVESEFENGQKGIKIIKFTTDDEELGQAPERIMAQEKILATKMGGDVRLVYLNPMKLRDLKLKWKINIIPTEKETSELKKALFMENIITGMQLFGPQSFNMEHLKMRWANYAGEDPNRMFIKQALPMGPQQPQGREGNRGLTADLAQANNNQQPSVNALIGNQ